MRQQHDAGPALGETRGEVVGGRSFAPLVREPVDLAAERLRDRGPAVAECTGGDDADAVAGRAQVRDRRLHRPGAARREEEHLVLGAEDLLQARERAFVDDAEVGAAVVDDRLGRRREYLGRHGRRAGREQVALLGHRLSLTTAGELRLTRVEALLAFAAALVALRLAGRVFARWRARRAAELLAWSAALFAYALASGALAWGAAHGWDARTFRVYYLFGGLLTAPLLGAGSLLIWRRRWAGPVALVYAGLAAGVAVAVPVHGDFAASAIPAAQDHLDFVPARLLAVLANSLGTAAVVVVAAATFR